MKIRAGEKWKMEATVVNHCRKTSNERPYKSTCQMSFDHHQPHNSRHQVLEKHF